MATAKYTKPFRARTHGMSKSPEYKIYRGMLNRCRIPSDTNYFRYGGRGIVVCVRWQESFENFLADMGCRPSPDHEIDRKDNSGPYEPGNCRWATNKENSRNRRNNHWVEFAGKRLTVAEWSEITGLDVFVLYARFKHGWAPARALTAPVRVSRRR